MKNHSVAFPGTILWALGKAQHKQTVSRLDSRAMFIGVVNHRECGRLGCKKRTRLIVLLCGIVFWNYACTPTENHNWKTCPLIGWAEVQLEYVFGMIVDGLSDCDLSGNAFFSHISQDMKEVVFFFLACLGVLFCIWMGVFKASRPRECERYK